MLRQAAHETATRAWVTYEIKESYKRGNGILGIRIHNIKNFYGQTDPIGNNPFDNLYVEDDYNRKTYLSQIYPTYDWVSDNGRINMGNWIETAAKKAGR